MPYPIQQGNTALPLRFLIVSSSDHITGATGKTPTVTIAKSDGLGFVTPAGAISELGSGWYTVAPHPSDASALGPLILHATASACDPADDEFLVVNYNPQATASQPTPDATTISVADLVSTALRRMRVLAVGDVLSPEMLATGHARLNELIDSLGIEPLTCYTRARTTWTLTSTKGTPTAPYTVGPSGDVNIARPIWIEALNYIDTSLTNPIERSLTLLTEQAYNTIPQKTLTSPLPHAAYYEPTYPTGSLYLWMIPTQAALQGVLYAMTALPKYGATADVIALPPGYQRMLRDQLVMELWPEYRDEDLPGRFVMAARESKMFVKAANLRMTDLRVDPAVLPHGASRYDIYSGGSS